VGNIIDFKHRHTNEGGTIMPAYEYECIDCVKEFAVFLSIKEYETNPKIVCPHCGSDNVKRNISDFHAKTSKKS
jgi:putative FmdB family regulatory protein